LARFSESRPHWQKVVLYIMWVSEKVAHVILTSI
jgi:hypothetical protein